MSVTRVPDALRARADTITDLTAITAPTNGMSVEVTDVNRGGLFVFDTSLTAAANNGTTFKATDATTGSWARQYSGAANVLWFGATTDGADSFVSVQAAFSSGVKLISLPSGEVVDVGSRIEIDGAGITFDLNGGTLRAHAGIATGTGLMRINGAGFKMRNGTIDAADRGTGVLYAGTGTVLINASNVLFDRCEFLSYKGHAIRVIGGSYITIRNNRFIGLDIVDCTAFQVDATSPGTDIVLEGNYCWGSIFCSVTGQIPNLYRRVTVRRNHLIRRAAIALRCIEVLVTDNFIDMEHQDTNSAYPGFAWGITFDRGYAGVISNNHISGFKKAAMEYVGTVANLPPGVDPALLQTGGVITGNILINDHPTLNPFGIWLGGDAQSGMVIGNNSLLNCGIYCYGNTDGANLDPSVGTDFTRNGTITGNTIELKRTGTVPIVLLKAVRYVVQNNVIEKSAAGATLAGSLELNMIHLDNVCADIVVRGNLARGFRRLVNGPLVVNGAATNALQTSGDITIEDNRLSAPEDELTLSVIAAFRNDFPRGMYRMSGNSVRGVKQYPTVIGTSGWSATMVGAGSVKQTPFTLGAVTAGAADTTTVAACQTNGEWLSRRTTSDVTASELMVGSGWHFDFSLHKISSLRAYDAGAGAVCRIIFGKHELDTGHGLLTPYGGATSGSLVNGRWYNIVTYVAGDDFTNIGAASNASGVIFKATGTTPTTWTNGSTVAPVYRTFGIEFRGQDAFGFCRNSSTGAVDYVALNLGLGTNRANMKVPLFIQSFGGGTASCLLFGLENKVYGSLDDLGPMLRNAVDGMLMRPGLHIEASNGNQTVTGLTVSGMQLTEF